MQQQYTPVIWVRQELFQQRVCPAIDLDLIAAYKIIDALRPQARDGLFSVEAWVATCRKVAGLSAENAECLFRGYKIMEAWSGLEQQFSADAAVCGGGSAAAGSSSSSAAAASSSSSSSSAAAAGVGAAPRHASVSLMAQFLFVRNYSIPPTTTAANLKLQLDTVYPSASAAKGKLALAEAHAHTSSSSPSSAGSPRRSSASASWTSTMKLRQSSAEQHCKYILKNFKSLLRLTLQDLADRPSFEQAVVSPAEVASFGFLFGACTEQVRHVC
jgi:hypothetical protein